MSSNKKVKGPWVQRFFIIFLSLVFGILLFWLLGFLMRDIGSLRGPRLSKTEAKYVDTSLVGEQDLLKDNLSAVKRDIKDLQERQKILKDSTDSLQNTINQLLDIQRVGIEKNLGFSAENQKTLTESSALFLENQKLYQGLNKEVTELTKQQHQLEKELSSVSGEVEKQRALARKEHDKLMRRHLLKVAILKLAVLLPMFLISAWFFIKKRSGTYGPIICAAFVTLFLKISFVVHEHFPSKYLKYVALLVIIGIVLKLLIYLLKRMVSPKKDWLVKQYQEAYDKYICPVCSKPVRTGPLRYVMGKKQGKLIAVGQGAENIRQDVYICPSCGTKLYEKCDKCGDICHSLLPFCEHCGSEKPGWNR